MKVVVLNFSGNVGKSTLTRHVLMRSLPYANLVSVESINADESEQEAIRGKEFGNLMEELHEHEHVVVDVGASNVEDFLGRMGQYQGSYEDFDMFIVPCVPTQKQQTDTLATINALAELGVESERIRVVLNRVDAEFDVRKVFNKIFAAYEMAKRFKLEPLIIVKENELYGLLQGKSIQEVLGDETDFGQKIKEATTREERLEWSKRRGLKRLALGVAEDLDRAFSLLLEGV